MPAKDLMAETLRPELNFKQTPNSKIFFSIFTTVRKFLIEANLGDNNAEYY
jgi:hypothetical protein